MAILIVLVWISLQFNGFKVVLMNLELSDLEFNGF